MRVAVKGYLGVRSLLGGETNLDLGDGATLEDLLALLVERHGQALANALFAPALGRDLPPAQILVNGRHFRYLPGGLAAALRDGDEVALFPPVVGG